MSNVSQTFKHDECYMYFVASARNNFLLLKLHLNSSFFKKKKILDDFIHVYFLLRFSREVALNDFVFVILLMSKGQL